MPQMQRECHKVNQSSVFTGAVEGSENISGGNLLVIFHSQKIGGQRDRETTRNTRISHTG